MRSSFPLSGRYPLAQVKPFTTTLYYPLLRCCIRFIRRLAPPTELDVCMHVCRMCVYKTVPAARLTPLEINTPSTPTGTYYYVRKAVVILFPAYILCCMFEVLDPPRPMMENARYSLMEALGYVPRVFSPAELKAEGSGSQRMLRCVVVVVFGWLVYLLISTGQWPRPEGMFLARYAHPFEELQQRASTSKHHIS